MKEYSFGIGHKVIVCICASIFAFVIVSLLYLEYFNLPNGLSFIYIIVPFSISFSIISILSVRDVFITRIVITDTYINVRSVVSNGKLRVEEIKGVKIGLNYITIYPKSNHQKKIKILIHIPEGIDLINELLKRFRDLDEEEEEKELEGFYRNNEYGFSKTEKEKKLKGAINTVRGINISSIILTVIIMLLNLSFTIAYTILISIPIIIIVIVFFFKGIIRYNEKKEEENTIYPSVFWGFVSPIFGLLFKIVIYINILNFDNLWQLFFGITILIFSLCIYGSKYYEVNSFKGIGKMTYLLLVCCMYSYFVIIFFNIIFDVNEVKQFRTTLLEKSIKKGQITSYYIELHNGKKLIKVMVPRGFYNKNKVGDTIMLKIKQGRLNIPYFEIE